MSAIDEKTYQDYYAALLAGDRRTCHEIVEALLADDIGLDDLYLNLYQRSLYEVGAGWERNEISVATEHVATALTQGLLQLSYRRLFSAPRRGRSFVMACTPREYHQVGALMITDLMELWGWDTRFVGANTPSADLKTLLSETAPDLIGLSVSLAVNVPGLSETVSEIRGDFPDIEIVVGGQGIAAVGLDSLPAVPKLDYVLSLDQLQTKARGDD